MAEAPGKTQWLSEISRQSNPRRMTGDKEALDDFLLRVEVA